MRITARRAMRPVGFVIGLMVAGVLVLDGWQAVAPHDPAAAVRLSIAPSGMLEVSPTGAIIDELALRPAATVAGEAQVRNITGVPLNIAFQAKSEGAELDDVLGIQLRAGDMLLFDDVVGELRGGSPQFQLASGHAVTVSVRAGLSDGAEAAGRSADVTVELVAQPEPGTP